MSPHLSLTAPSTTAPTSRTGPTIKPVVTLHPDTSVPLQLALLVVIEETLLREGVALIWIDSGSAQLVVVAEVA